jgi:hypothetical protein
MGGLRNAGLLMPDKRARRLLCMVLHVLSLLPPSGSGLLLSSSILSCLQAGSCRKTIRIWMELEEGSTCQNEGEDKQDVKY